MQQLRTRLRFGVQRDDGLTLIEVVVAMMIFMVISTGLLYTMTSLLGVTRDSRARQVASNLAAQEIDLSRAIGDIFAIQDVTRSVQLNGDTFTVLRTAEWVSNPALTEPCGAGGGTLRYKRVQVVVSWEGKRPGAADVVSNTLINPRDRISDPELGTILVSVATATGIGVPGVQVTAKLAPGSTPTLTATTDAKGCAFFLRVVPSGTGEYTVGIKAPAGTNYVDFENVEQPSTTTAVVRATSASIDFTYDRAGIVSTTWRAAGAVIPSNLSTSFLSTRDPVISVGTASTNPRSILISPWPDGYSVIAGNSVACPANDPGRWTAAGAKPDGERPAAVSAASAETTYATVPMGSVTVNGLSSTTRYIVAKSVNTTPLPAGQPACATEQILRFPQSASSSTSVVSLPYGSWTLYRGNSTTFTPASGNLVPSGSLVAGTAGTVGTSGVITFDPRGL